MLAFGLATVAGAQVPSVLKTEEQSKTTSKDEPERTLSEWRADVESRLTEAEAQATEDKQDDQEPSPELKRHLEILARIELVLEQLSDELSKTKKLEEDREAAKAALDKIVQQGLDDDQASLQQLDQIREDLKAETKRLNRIADKEKSVAAALEKAQEELRKKNAERLLVKEKSAGNQDDNKRQELGQRLAERIDESELSKATVRLRRQEVLNAKAAKETQKLRVQALEERLARLKLVVKFGPQELSALFEKLDRQEDDLKNRVTKFENAAELQLRVVEEQWISARRKFDSTTEDKTQLQEKINAFELEYLVLKKTPPLLRLQLDLLNRDRQAWRHRQRVFTGTPDRETVQKWVEETTEALGQIKREERKWSFEVEELRERLQQVEERGEKYEKPSVEANAIEKQLTSLRSLLKSHEESVASVRTSMRLHERLLGELEGDSLAATAKDHLQSLWNRGEAVWNYPLATFGEGDDASIVTVQKVVTAVMVLLAGMIFSRALSRTLGRQVLRRLDIDPSASATIQSLFYYVLLLIFGLFALNVAKVPLTAFTVLGGAVALGIGFGSQNIINNFISGLILLAERPVKVGDLIQLDQANGERIYGNIEHIGARSTRVRTGSNLEIIVPNSSFLQNNVVNFTLSSDKVRTLVTVGVVYGSPTVTVTQMLRRAVIETGRVAKDPPPIILFKDFADSALIFEVHFWIRMRTMMDQLQIESAVRFRIDQLFREEGITIAFPQQDVHINTVSPLEVQMIAAPAGSDSADIRPRDDKS